MEINLRAKPLFSGGSDNSCLKRERWKTMTVVVEWQRHLPPENVSRVEPLIKKDPKMAYSEVQDIMKISSGSLTRILHNYHGITKNCACWVPHNLCEEQKWSRVDWCTHMQRKIDGGRSPRVWVIVTGDETWVYQYHPETKLQLEVWVFPDENPPVKFKRNRSA